MNKDKLERIYQLTTFINTQNDDDQGCCGEIREIVEELLGE